MRKMIPTVAAAMTVSMTMTGYQARPARDNGQTTQATVEQTIEEQTATVAKKVSPDEIRAAVKETYSENYIPSAVFDEQGMKKPSGINSDLYNSFIAGSPMVGAHVGTFVVVKVKESKGKEVAQYLNSYHGSQLNGATQYPMNLPEIEASQVVRHGDYVFSVMLRIPSEEMGAQGGEAALESVKENTQTAIDIIDGYFAS